MAPDCGINTTGPAINTAQEFFVVYCITFTFLLLCLVPFWVHLVMAVTIYESYIISTFLLVFL